MKDSMYKQVGFLYTFEIMVSKERRGSFNVLSPFLLFYFFLLCFALFFLAVGGVPCGVTESKVQCKTVSGGLHRR